MNKNYRFIDPPLEVLVGDAVEMVLECTGELSPLGMPHTDPSEILTGNCFHRTPHCFLTADWVGIYPASIPTVPGVSHGRWKYISTFTETNAIAQEQITSDKLKHEKHRKVLTFDPSFLPNHAGEADRLGLFARPTPLLSVRFL